jgi:hypothetical protein
MFGGGFEEMNVQQWIHTINATGDVFGWDDKARIFCMTNKLRGNAKSWYNNQDKLDLSWKQWKKNLIEAFLPNKVCLTTEGIGECTAGKTSEAWWTSITAN